MRGFPIACDIHDSPLSVPGPWRVPARMLRPTPRRPREPLFRPLGRFLSVSSGVSRRMASARTASALEGNGPSLAPGGMADVGAVQAGADALARRRQVKRPRMSLAAMVNHRRLPADSALRPSVCGQRELHRAERSSGPDGNPRVPGPRRCSAYPDVIDRPFQPDPTSTHLENHVHHVDHGTAGAMGAKSKPGDVATQVGERRARAHHY
jgi:hypothetical protein